jgi:hypothetical protein
VIAGPQQRSSVRTLNLALKFLLELAAFLALGLWGASTAHGAGAALLAVGLPAVAVCLWGTVAAPKARHRLPLRLRAPFELGVFAGAAIALWGAGLTVPAAIFAAIAALNALLLTALDQWES